MKKMKLFQSGIVSILIGGCLLSFMSAIQKYILKYPLYPVSFIVPFTAGAIAGLLYHLRWKVEQKHHKKIEQYNKRLETILETVQSGIIIIDAKTSIIESINPTAQRLYGYSESEIIGKKCYYYLCDSNPEKCHILHQDLAFDTVEQAEIKTTELNIPIIRKAKKVSFDDNSHIIVSVMDISPIVETEKKLREANEKVRIADRLKTEFLTNIGHEIRTPLNAVIGISELLMSELLPDDTINDLKLINNAGKSLLETMENMMDFALLKSGSYELQNNSFNLYQTLCFVSDQYRGKATEKGLTLQMNIENCKCVQYVGDQSVIKKVIGNVLDNAIKFTPSGTVTVKTDYISTLAMIDIQISDTGIGIPEQKQAVIFDAFYQIDGSLTRDFEGTGIGLALVDYFVKIMGASIKIESTIDSGSTFHIHLPV